MRYTTNIHQLSTNNYVIAPMLWNTLFVLQYTVLFYQENSGASYISLRSEEAVRRKEIRRLWLLLIMNFYND